MRKVWMIDPDNADMFHLRYTRCGRTDKGVSALGNVCSLEVREFKNDDYTARINKVLPADIRMLGHAVVPEAFDSRFSCIFREYNYFFFAEQFDVRLMAKSAQKLVGLHDFRNFCKKDDSIAMRASHRGEEDEDSGNGERAHGNLPPLGPPHVQDRLPAYVLLHVHPEFAQIALDVPDLPWCPNHVRNRKFAFAVVRSAACRQREHHALVTLP